MKWKEIEDGNPSTLPDKYSILALVRIEYNGYVDVVAAQYWPKEYASPGNDGWNVHGGIKFPSNWKATHWMPFPDPNNFEDQ